MILAVLFPPRRGREHRNQHRGVQRRQPVSAACEQLHRKCFNQTVITGFDWVKDCLANLDLDRRHRRGRPQGALNGFRVLDGIAGDDQDIFLTGGKENDHETRNPGRSGQPCTRSPRPTSPTTNQRLRAGAARQLRADRLRLRVRLRRLADPGLLGFWTSSPERGESSSPSRRRAWQLGQPDTFRFVHNDPDVTGTTPELPDGVEPTPTSTAPTSRWGSVRSSPRSIR